MTAPSEREIAASQLFKLLMDFFRKVPQAHLNKVTERKINKLAWSQITQRSRRVYCSEYLVIRIYVPPFFFQNFVANHDSLLKFSETESSVYFGSPAPVLEDFTSV